eukprot:TRINITY_DN20916_c0_g1_i1.p1 TRINITY_DN20916_c0_g1~~TRINITY_DN20916_c0_g1_i1.p1  ORF type:complete len:214 (+),score=31.89 TRINITY_DN20916_c0_g1_i1:110-751(+)
MRMSGGIIFQKYSTDFMLLSFFSLVLCGAANENLRISREEITRAARVARNLVAQSEWTVVSTISSHLGGAPYGNVQSLSDGVPGNSTGIPYFYLSLFDATPWDLSADSRASITLSAAALGEKACIRTDPENPTCARVTLTGNIVLVPEAEEEFARLALFSKHPFMKRWPERDHRFHFYKMIILHVTVIDFYGPAKTPSVQDYFAATDLEISNT